MRGHASRLLPLAALAIAGCMQGDSAATSDSAGPAAVPASAAAPALDADDGALHPADSPALARRIVTQSLRLREGDRVLISGGARDLALLEDLAVRAAAVGADPLVTILSDRMTRLMYDSVPARYDTVQSPMTRGLIGITDAQILVDVNQNPKILEGVPPERMAARAKATVPLNLLALRRGIRTVNLGNELYPTAARAAEFGMSQADLARLFWGGIDVDYAQLQAAGDSVRRLLERGTEAHVTNANGTDVTMRIAGQPVYVSDGVISAEDEKRGGAALLVYLPAGEVYVPLVPGSARGTVVVDHYVYQGSPVDGLRLVIENGRVTSMTATSGLDALRAAYDAAGAGKELFGVLDVGINPNVRIPQGSRMVGWMPAGMVTFFVGNDTWAGGTNNANFGLPIFVPGSTLTIDGTPLVRDGALQSRPQVAGR
jgi:leucyl aminopeptidase (aminopeptidase T)